MPQRMPDDPGMQAAWRELCTLLDEEVQRMPDRYKAPLVLCYLESQTRDHAARQLGWSLRTLERRLTQGREILRARLARRGVTLSAGLLAAAIIDQAACAAMPAALREATSKAAASISAGGSIATTVSSRVAVLIQEGLPNMLWTRLQTLTVLTIIVAGASGGGVLLLARSTPTPAAGQDFTANTAEQDPASAEAVATADTPAPRTSMPQQKSPQSAAERMRSQNNLHQLALAMHNYADTYAHFPAPAIYGGESGAGGGDPEFQGSGPGDSTVRGSSAGGPAGGGIGSPGPATMGRAAAKGRALLSWRVAILPFIEQGQLYRQFHLNEPWDSPHNKKLLAAMPKLYAPVGKAGNDNPTSTFYQVFVGPHAGFQKHKYLRFADIVDGSSNTIMIAEGGHAVPWTKPEDMAYDADEPLPELGGLFKEGTNVAMFDGSVLFVPRNADETMIRAAVTRDGGEAIDHDRLFGRPGRVPGTPRATDRGGLLEENKRLTEEYKQLKELIEQLKEEVKLSQAGADKESSRLQEANERLRAAVQKLAVEAEILKDQLRNTKQPPRGR
jgi:hypothetical protein